MQKFKDSQNLDAMFRMAGGGGDDDDEEEDEPRKRSKLPLDAMNRADEIGKHTSMTKEATRAIKDLKNARKAKEERANQRVSCPLYMGIELSIGGT
jgi:RNA polymerase-associated protein RTF1